MLDVIYIVLIVAFFLIAILYIEGCDSLKKGEGK